MELDPNDPRKRYEQVAGHLRASILTGDLNPGDRLETVTEMAERYGVSKTTVERAVDILKAEHLVIARQGAGTFIRETSTKPAGLRPHIEAAFEAESVSIDFIGFSGETLHGAITECLDKVRNGRYRPKSIAVRMILPDTSRPWAVPARQDGTDSPEFRQRHQQTIERYTGGLVEIVDELAQHGLIDSGSVDIRVVGAPPLNKLYLVNDSDAFFGWYSISKHKVRYQGKTLSVVDLMGKDSELLHFNGSQHDQAGSAFVAESQRFFEAQWDLVATLQH